MMEYLRYEVMHSCKKKNQNLCIYIERSIGYIKYIRYKQYM